MMNYADKTILEENKLIRENGEVIDAFLTIMERRIAEDYYNTIITGEMHELVNRMEAYRLVHRELNVFVTGKTEAEGA